MNRHARRRRRAADRGVSEGSPAGPFDAPAFASDLCAAARVIWHGMVSANAEPMDYRAEDI